MRQLILFGGCALFAMQVAAAVPQWYRCTAADGSYSVVVRGKAECPHPDDHLQSVEVQKPLADKPAQASDIVKCISRKDGHKLISKGGCPSADYDMQILSPWD